MDRVHRIAIQFFWGFFIHTLLRSDASSPVHMESTMDRAKICCGSTASSSALETPSFSPASLWLKSVRKPAPRVSSMAHCSARRASHRASSVWIPLGRWRPEPSTIAAAAPAVTCWGRLPAAVEREPCAASQSFTRAHRDVYWYRSGTVSPGKRGCNSDASTT